MPIFDKFPYSLRSQGDNKTKINYMLSVSFKTLAKTESTIEVAATPKDVSMSLSFFTATSVKLKETESKLLEQ
jgi:hypothetical protein